MAHRCLEDLEIFCFQNITLLELSVFFLLFSTLFLCLRVTCSWPYMGTRTLHLKTHDWSITCCCSVSLRRF